MQYAVKCSFSWTNETERQAPCNTVAEAFEAACLMAGKEAFAQNSEFDPGKTCAMFVDASQLAIDLTYHSDNTVAHFRVVGLIEKEGEIVEVDLTEHFRDGGKNGLRPGSCYCGRGR